MAFTVSDEVLSSVVPVIVYWIYSGMYVMLDDKLEKYRLHSKVEEDALNTVSKWTVVKMVLFHQAIQIVFMILTLSDQKDGIRKPNPPLYIIAVQFLVGSFVFDTWQYFTHRLLHTNRFLYKHVHSIHHRMVVPYPYGASFGNLLEGTIIDTGGGLLAFWITGMTPRVAIYFFSFLTIKGVDVHSGVWWPYNILNILFSNTSAYHQVHHQLYGVKNYAQPLFISWDKLLGTHMPFVVEKKKEGGYKVRPVKDD